MRTFCICGVEVSALHSHYPSYLPALDKAEEIWRATNEAARIRRVSEVTHLAQDEKDSRKRKGNNAHAR